jgi:hypothetical protein
VKVIVFCGPTIDAEDVRREIDADVRPPAARGDVLRAGLERPAAIALVDGYFHRVPSVWHKEILWAMAEGIHVVGSASMGALRAAELAPFGMEGFGEIFQSFVSGACCDDDEVAVVHGPAEQGYRSLSEAMVNIRATVRAAQAAGIVSESAREVLEALAKRTSYPQRNYSALLAGAQGAAPADELRRLRDWLPVGRVDQKRRDAQTMLAAVRERQRAGWLKKTVDYDFAVTDAWNMLRAEVTLETDQRAGNHDIAMEDLTDELLLAGRLGRDAMGGLARALCLEQAARWSGVADDAAVAGAAEDFRRERGLLGPDEFDGWLQAQSLRGDDVDEYFRHETVVRRARVVYRFQALANIADHLRATGDYEAVVQRAATKRQVLDAHGLERPELSDTGLTEEELWRWYFQRRLGREGGVAPAAHAQREGTDLETLRAAVIREHCYSRIAGLLDP